MKVKRQVFAVVRVEHQYRLSHVPRDELPTWIRVSKVLPAAREAVAEADRLNALNGRHGSFYFAISTRWFPHGRGGDTAYAGQGGNDVPSTSSP